MGTPAKMALDGLDVMELFEHRETIRAALKIMDAVQSGRLKRDTNPAEGLFSSIAMYNDGYNHCLDRLKQIAGE